MERLKKLLEDNGLKPTYQRLKVLEYLDRHIDTHPTAEMIYDALSRNMPTISVTTVYNTLNAFLQTGLVSAETITGTEVRYDLVTHPHHHFLCRMCGTIIDVDVTCPVVEAKTKVINGHTIEEVHGYFKGVCEKCNREKTECTKKS
ncbi:MAG: transcriptional repressor [candidate division WOR-3 bacterium]|nr:MAG: transcriptional repressor [candidate division WOR-3 bacterium]